MIVMDSQPGYVQALYNKLVFELTNTEYTLGTTHYCEVYNTGTRDIFLDQTLVPVNGTLVTTLVKNGDGTGKCSFDVSGVLSSQLPDDQVVPNSTDAVQHDFDAYVGYYVKIGVLSYNASGQEVKTLHWESYPKWAFRGAFPLKENTNYQDYYVRYTNYAKFLTNSPVNAEIRKDETTFLGSLVPVKVDNPKVESRAIHLMADFHFNDGTSLLDKKVNSTNHTSGHVLIHNVRPDRMGLNPVQLSKLDRMSVWLDYEETLKAVDTTPDWRFDTSTIRCEQNAPRTNSNRVALKLDVNPESPTYSTYQGGNNNYQYYDNNAAACPLPPPPPAITWGWESANVCATANDSIGDARYYRFARYENGVQTAKYSYLYNDAGYDFSWNDAWGLQQTDFSLKAQDEVTYKGWVDAMLAHYGVTDPTKSTMIGQSQFQSDACTPAPVIKAVFWSDPAAYSQSFPDQSGGEQRYEDIYVELRYENGTPATVTSLTVNYRETTEVNYPTGADLTVTITNASKALIFSGYTVNASYNDSDGSENYHYYTQFFMLPGTGYTI